MPYTFTIPGLVAQWNAFRGLAEPPSLPIALWQEGGRGLWIDNAWGPAVPYPPVDHGDGHQNHGYVRIKDDLDLVTKIPETTDFPELSTFLLAINSPDSPIESVGCECGFFPSDVGGSPPIKVGSYIDVMFTDIALNDCGENALALASQLLQGVEGCELWWANVSAVMQRFRYIPQTEAPWGLMLHISAYGRSESEAYRLWVQTLDRLGGAVRALPRDFKWRATSP